MYRYMAGTQLISEVRKQRSVTFFILIQAGIRSKQTETRENKSYASIETV